MRNHLFIDFDSFFARTDDGFTLTPAALRLKTLFSGYPGVASSFDFTLLVEQAKVGRRGPMELEEITALIRQCFFVEPEILGELSHMQPNVQLYSRLQTEDPLLMQQVKKGEIEAPVGFDVCFAVYPCGGKMISAQENVLFDPHHVFAGEALLIAMPDRTDREKPLGSNIIELFGRRFVKKLEVNPWDGYFSDEKSASRAVRGAISRVEARLASSSESRLQPSASERRLRRVEPGAGMPRSRSEAALPPSGGFFARGAAAGAGGDLPPVHPGSRRRPPAHPGSKARRPNPRR